MIDCGKGKEMSDLANQIDETVADLVADIIDNLSNEAFEAACNGSFRSITHWNVQDVDALWINANPSSIKGTVDAWTIEVRLGVDSDCGKADYDLIVSGGLTLGRTRFDSVVLA